MFTVADMLKLPTFAGYEIAAGKNGTGKCVRFVDFIEVPDVIKWALRDTFYFTTGYAFRESPDQICRLIEAFSRNGASGMGIKLGRYIDALPEEVLKIADDLNFPLVLMPIGLAYAIVSRTVMREIFRAEQSQRDGDETLNLFQLEQDPVGLLEALNLRGWKNATPVWSLQWENLPPQQPSLPQERAFQCSVDYSLRMFVAQSPHEQIDDFIEFLKYTLPRLTKHQNIGISGPAPLEKLVQSFAEATVAMQIGRQLGFDEGIFVYSELELLDLLQKDHPLPVLRKAAQRSLHSLFEEDAKKHSALVETLRVWFACDGSSEKTACKLHVHRNTLLYRLKRIMELLPLGRCGTTPFRLALFLAYDDPTSEKFDSV